MPCPSNKVQHRYADAKRLAARASRTYETPMTEYRCSECGAWHVGSRTHKPQPMRWVRNDHELRIT